MGWGRGSGDDRGFGPGGSGASRAGAGESCGLSENHVVGECRVLIRRVCTCVAGFSLATSVFFCTREGFGRAGVACMRIRAPVRGWRILLANGQESEEAWALRLLRGISEMITRMKM